MEADPEEPPPVIHFRYVRAVATLAVALALVLPTVAAEPGGGALEFLDFDAASFRRAMADDRLVLLVLDMPWSEQSRTAATVLWQDPEIAAAVREGYVAIRERADLRPDLMRRYPAEGWPALSILLPDGTPLFLVDAAGARQRRLTSGLRPSTEIANWLRNSRAYYSQRRDLAVRASREAVDEIAKSVVPAGGAIDETAIWARARQLRYTFDEDARYFGGPPRLPRFELIEAMLNFAKRGEPSWSLIGMSALDTLDRHLVDGDSGGLYRMALGDAWENPQRELLLDRNARYLDLLATAYRLGGRLVHRERGLRVARFLVDRLGRSDGSFAAGLCAACPGGIDATALSGEVALAGAALIRAGAAFGDDALVERGVAAAEMLVRDRHRTERGIARFVVGDRPILDSELEDLASVTALYLAAHEATGEADWLARAQDAARIALSRLRDPSSGALRDTVTQPTGPPPLRFALYPLDDNAAMARTLDRLGRVAGQALYRDAAIGILRAFSAAPDRVPLWVPHYVLAGSDVLLAPVEVEVRWGPRSKAAARDLARAALGADAPAVVVRWLPGDPSAESASVVARYRDEASRVVTEAAEVRGAIAYLVGITDGAFEIPRPPESSRGGARGAGEEKAP